MSKKHIKGKLPPGQWTAMRWQMLDSAAWKQTSFGARALYLALARQLSNTRMNNGQLWLSCRDAGKQIGANKDTVGIWYHELEHYGFIVKTSPAYLGSKGKGKSAHYRLTDMEWGAEATRDYNFWDGEIFEPKNRIPSGKPIQGVRKTHTVDGLKRANGHPGNGTVSGKPIHTDPPHCPENPDISRSTILMSKAGQSEGRGRPANSLAELVWASVGGTDGA